MIDFYYSFESVLRTIVENLVTYFSPLRLTDAWKMADVSDAAIHEAIRDVRDDHSETNW